MNLVIVANSNHCKIYEYTQELNLVSEFKDPDAKLKSKDLGTDRPGHYQSMTGRGAYSPETSPKEVEIDNLAREVAREVNDLRHHHAIKKIILIAEAKMDGRLMSNFSTQIKDLITNNIKKDILFYSDKELLSYLKENAQYAE